MKDNAGKMPMEGRSCESICFSNSVCTSSCEDVTVAVGKGEIIKAHCLEFYTSLPY